MIELLILVLLGIVALSCSLKFIGFMLKVGLVLLAIYLLFGA